MVSAYKWHYGSGGYAKHHQAKLNKFIYMHRLIMNTPKGMETDHINGNRLDNRKENLRIVTISQNQMNRAKLRSNSGHRGVWWYKSNNKYKAAIVVNQKTIYLGYFTDLDSAIKAYDEAQIKYHGEFANKSAKD